MGPLLSDVAIIGAGLGGCAAALALSSRNVRVTVYESRREDGEELRSGVLLSPNGLRVLDRLGVFERIRGRCWVATHRRFRDDLDNVVSETRIAHEQLYGYANHRVWRKLLLDEMRAMLRERAVPVRYAARFTGFVSVPDDDDDNDDPDSNPGAAGVTFTINDQPVTASLLLASDGLHSAVRAYLAPGVEPSYTGVVGVLAHIQHDAVAWPSADYPRSATIQGPPGALFYIPEDPDGTQLMVGIQREYNPASVEVDNNSKTNDGNDDKDQQQQQQQHDSKAVLAALYRSNPDALLEFFQRDAAQWRGETPRKLIAAVAAARDTLYAWPYMRMPALPHWFTPHSGRVVLLGDAAHALPPSSGQGVNQALEDAYSLMLLLTAADDDAAKPAVKLLPALRFWQELRQARIDDVADWATHGQNVARLPAAERERLLREGKVKVRSTSEDMSWLYRPRLEEDVEAWIAAQV